MSHSPSKSPMRPGGDAVDLSEHLRWMRALARGLVRDEATADDVVQEAAMAALGEESRPANVRAWLASVLRNRARDVGRRSAAVRRREAEHARPEGGDETHELEERAAIGAELSQRVLGLDEPLRSTLLMRYWDDLPPRVIAKRTGVPVATVKSRLARGLAGLRRDLDESRDGDRSAWLMVVLPLARKTPLIAAPAAAGWTLMNTKVTAAAAAAALVGGALYLLPEEAPAADGSGSSSPPPTRESSIAGGGGPAGGGSTDSGLQARPSPGSRRAPSGSSAAPTPAPIHALAARVVDGEARPVSGVRVGLEDTELAADTDRAGRIAFETGLSSGTLIAMDPGSWTTVRPGNWRAADVAPPLVVVAPALTLGGAVVDEFGFPLEGALVDIQMPGDFLARFDDSFGSSVRARWEVSAGSDGIFAFDGAPLIAGAKIVAAYEGRGQASMEVPAGSRSDILLVLRRPAAPEATALRGRVLRGDGRPATEARVALGTELVATDEDGTFELDLALVGPGASLRAIESGSLPAVYDRPGDPEGPRGGWPESVELRLGDAPLTISGVVVNNEGEPLAGARVWLDDPTEFGTLGVFPVRQEALAAGLAPSDAAVRSLSSLGEPGAGESHGSATDVGPPNASLQWVQSDGDGRFEIDGLSDRAYVLNVLGPDLDYLGRSDRIPAGADDARITIDTGQRHGELRGRIVTRTGAPVPNVFVTPWIPALSAEIDVRDGTSSVTRYFLAKGVTSDEEGEFVLRNIPRRFVQFYVGGPSILPGYSSVDAVTDPDSFEIVVSARVEVSVEVIDSTLGVDAVTALDADGKPMQLLRMFADGYSTFESIAVEGGRTGAFALTTDAAALQLRSRGALVETIPLTLMPGQVNRVVH